MIDLDSLLYDAERADRQPRVHGNGFLQLDLNEEGTRRLHVWHDDLPRQRTKSNIHDHVFALRSTVICGRLEHIEYDLEPNLSIERRRVRDHVNGPSLGTWEVYRAERVGPGNNTELRPSGEIVGLRLRHRYVFEPGESYTFPAWSLHSTDYHGLTATVMEKVDALKGYGRPRVLVRADDTPDNDFDRDSFDPKQLWPYVEAALAEARRVALRIART